MKDENVESATAVLLADVAESGLRWIRGANGWRRDLTRLLRHQSFSLMDATGVAAIKNGLAQKITNRTEISGELHFVVQPFGPADKAGWAPTIGIEARKNQDKLVQLCFNVAFFGKKDQSLKDYTIISFGHRFDSPEGSDTSHNYYHAQPLKGWRDGKVLPGAFQVQPDTFPTFPLDATDSLDLALHALHVACGYKYIENLANYKGSAIVAERARILQKKLKPVLLE